jgi:hypothetical protein
MFNNIAGLLNDSRKINGIKKKSGSLGFELSSTENLVSSSTSSGNSFRSKDLLFSVSIFIY